MRRITARGVDRLAGLLPFVLPASIYGLVVMLYYGRLQATLALPDYGDLWRMSVRYSSDGRLHLTEPFVEAQPFAHIPIVHAVLNHVAITRADYTVLWVVGGLAAVATGWAVGSGVVAVLPGDDRGPISVLGAALIGVLAFRFDVRNLVTNSLLLESQFLFLQGTLAMVVAGWYAKARDDRLLLGGVNHHRPVAARLRPNAAVSAREIWLLAALLGLLVVGDAPAGVLSVVMVGLALTAGFVARNPVNTTFRILGAVAVVALGIRWLGLWALGAEGETSSNGALDLASTLLGTLKLIGAGFVNLTAVFVGSQATYDRIHIALALVVVPLWAAVALRLLRRVDVHPALVVGLSLAVGFVVTSALAIAAIRGVGVNHQGSRAVRGTALAAPISLASLYIALRASPRTAARASAVTLAMAVGLMSVRGFAFTNSYEHVGDVVRYRERTATIVCEQPRTVERWDLLWPGFNEASIDEALASEHLDIARRAGCEEVAVAGGDR